MNLRPFTLNLLFLLSVVTVFAQKGKIAGKVIEAASGFEIIGANVVLESKAATGSSTDLDGNYIISDLEPGTYTLICSYLGYNNQKIGDVLVEADKVTTIDFQMGEAPIQLEVAIVTGKRVNNTEAAIIAIQRKAPVVLNGISSSQISKNGDNDVASAVKRVTGVTVEGGKYVYVRGLGDRYSKTTLNSATIPGLDPNKNTVQMDLFPTSLIDNIVVYKTFAPNLPGDFTGGYVDISTKDFPTTKTINASASVGYNTLSTFNSNYLTYEGGKNDWLGFDDGTRAIPDLIQNNSVPLADRGSNINPAKANLLTELTSAFNNNLVLQNSAPSPDYNLGFSIGNQKSLFGKPLGIIAALSYQREFEHYNNGSTGIYELTGQYGESRRLTTQLALDDTKSTDNVLWGAMLNTSLKLNQNHKIGLTAMHNQSATTVARYQEGKKQRDDPDDSYQTRTWQFLQRGLSTVQLKGKHVFEDLNNTELLWQSSYALSTQDEPDLRFFTNRYRENSNGERTYFLKPSSDRLPVRYFRNMDETNLDNKIDLSIPFNQWGGLSSKAKFGASYLIKARDFREERFNYSNQTAAFSGDISEYLSETNILKYNYTESMYMNGGNGVFIVDAYEPANNYDASQQVAAAYGMLEIPLTKKLRAVTGARMETTSIQFYSFSEVIRQRYALLNGKDNILNNVDILPSVNLNYELSDRTQLRFAYNKTLARPTFRELAPFESFDFMGGFITIGNPELERTLTDNVDLRWEFYPASGEMISVSAFYKNFDNPIERTYNPEAPNGEFTFRNVDQAMLAGAEFEASKNLSFLSQALADFSLSTNFTYIYSKTEIDERELSQIRATNPDAGSTREMFGQAPFIVNALLSYKNEGSTSANMAFNITGSRISYISIGGTPNIYELPRASLNFNISHQFENGIGLKCSLGNLLNAKYKQAITYQGEDYYVQENELGRSFSVGVSYRIP